VRFLSKSLKLLLLSFGVIAIWRGIWGLLDLFLVPSNELSSYITSIIIGLAVLMLVNHRLDELL